MTTALTYAQACVQQVLAEDPDVTLITPVSYMANGRISGAFRLTLEGQPLDFEVWVPPIFPLNDYLSNSLVFVCKEISGYPYQRLDHSLCIHPVNGDEPLQKTKQELALVKEWMRRFYLHEENDPNAPLFIPKEAYSKHAPILYTQVQSPFEPGDWGCYAMGNAWRGSSTHAFLTRLSGKPCQWASHIHESCQKHEEEGFWAFLPGEPVVARKQVVSTWRELRPHLTEAQYEQIVLRIREGSKAPLLLGHYIGDSDEVRWHAVNLPPPQTWAQMKNEATDTPLQWRATSDASYERFFGRGKLCDALTDARILVIGCGAIGSQLVDVLVRGGCRSLVLYDPDWVETGNICRGRFHLSEVGFQKPHAIKLHQEKTSPFVDIRAMNEGFIAATPGTQGYQAQLGLLAEIDLIFDCSTDMSVAHWLDQIQPAATIVNLSLSTDAAALVAATGKRIVEDKAHLFQLHGQQNEIDLFTPAGCAYPTFRASYLDVNTLLSITIQHIQTRLREGISLRSFVVTTKQVGEAASYHVDAY